MNRWDGCSKNTATPHGVLRHEPDNWPHALASRARFLDFTAEVIQERAAHQFVENARADAAIPFIAEGTRGDFAEIKSDDVAAGLGKHFQQVAYLGECEAAGDRRTCLRAMLTGQAIDIKRDVHLVRKRGDDVFAHCAPCGAIELTIAHALVKERGDAALGILNELRFALAEISDSYLHQLLDAGQTRHHIVEDAGVAPRETFERIAQIRMRIDLQNAHAWMAQ